MSLNVLTKNSNYKLYRFFIDKVSLNSKNLQNLVKSMQTVKKNTWNNTRDTLLFAPHFTIVLNVSPWTCTPATEVSFLQLAIFQETTHVCTVHARHVLLQKSISMCITIPFDIIWHCFPKFTNDLSLALSVEFLLLHSKV